ncbi:hypothetical protein QZH41_013067 [Actinostola sp. cb2023]|nr:hypothetical protein QZH41_013067 [Actinostola sp. cb2023]
MVKIGGIKLEVPIDLPIKLPVNLPFDTSKIPDIQQIKDIDPKKLFVQNIVRFGWTKENCLRLRKSFGESMLAVLFFGAGSGSGFIRTRAEEHRHAGLSSISSSWCTKHHRPQKDTAKMGIMALGIFLGSMSGLALLNGIAATGRTRFSIYTGWKSKCCGRCCILMLFGWHAIVWLIWTIIGPILLFPLIFMGIGFAVCQVKLVKQLGKTCIDFDEYGVADLVNVDKVCGYELAEFCSGISPATPYFAVTFVGAIFIIFGVFIMLIALIVNLLQVHKHIKAELPSEWSTCKACCDVEDPDKYDDCWPEPPVEEVPISMREKLQRNHVTHDGNEPNPHGQAGWSYIYDFEQETEIIGKRY